MGGALEFEEEVVRKLDAVYQTRDVVRRRELVYEALAPQPGERILDVGCGPGYYVLELAKRVGPDGAVTGVDPSGPMLAVARARSGDAANVDLREGEATALPVDDAAFDAAISVQVLEYVPDVGAALAELHRVLRPGGRLVLWDVDWATVSWYSEDPARMERVLAVWDEHNVHPSLPRTLAPQLRAAGFDDVRMEAHAFATAELTFEAYGGSLVGVIEQFLAARDDVSQDEAAAWAAEQRDLGERGEFYFAVMQACFTATRA